MDENNYLFHSHAFIPHPSIGQRCCSMQAAPIPDEDPQAQYDSASLSAAATGGTHLPPESARIQARVISVAGTKKRIAVKRLTPLRDGEKMRTHSNGQDWVVSWHHSTEKPTGRAHGATGVCLTPRRVGSHQPRRRSLGFPSGSPRGKRTTRRDSGAGGAGRGLRPSHRLPVARILPQPLHRGSRAGLSTSVIVVASGSHGATIRAPLRGPSSPTDSS